jgi:hypothetical protein
MATSIQGNAWPAVANARVESGARRASHAPTRTFSDWLFGKAQHEPLAGFPAAIPAQRGADPR